MQSQQISNRQLTCLTTLLGSIPDLFTEQGRSDWIVMLFHCFHLRLIDRTKLERCLAIARSVIDPRLNIVIKPNDFKLFATPAIFCNQRVRVIQSQSLGHITKEEWDLALGFIAKHSKVEVCVLCKCCPCGCGRNHDELFDLVILSAQREAEAREVDSLLKAGYTEAAQIREYQNRCKHGRWFDKACTCSPDNILQLLKLRKVVQIPSKRTRRMMSRYLIEWKRLYRLNLVQVAALRHHILICSAQGSGAVNNPWCRHSPKEILSLHGVDK